DLHSFPTRRSSDLWLGRRTTIPWRPCDRAAGSCRRTTVPSDRACATFKELLPRAFQFSQLRSRFFFDGHQFVASLLSLPSELRFESFLALGVALFPNRGVVFDLLLHHRVEDDRD